MPSSDKTLVVKQGSLESMTAAIETTHDALGAHVDAMLSGVNNATVGWDQGTASRAAEMDYQRRLKVGMDQLRGHLDAIRTCVGKIAADAHETEVENVAIVD